MEHPPTRIPLAKQGEIVHRETIARIYAAPTNPNANVYHYSEMTQLSNFHQPGRGRIFPESTIPLEELARRQAKRVGIGDRSRAIFD